MIETKNAGPARTSATTIDSRSLTAPPEKVNTSSQAQTPRPKKKPGELTMFVPSWVDDAGLTLHEFRIYARVARWGHDRGGCHQSVEKLAEQCRMKPQSVRRALKSLVSKGLVTVKERRGGTNCYEVTPPPMGRSPNGQVNGPEVGNGAELGMEGCVPRARDSSAFESTAPTGSAPKGSERLSAEECIALCWDTAERKSLPPRFVEHFVAMHLKDNWTIDGRPIRNIPKALHAWCASMEKNESEFDRDKAEVKCWALHDEGKADLEATNTFITDMDKADWMLLNADTGQMERVRDVEAALMRFDEHYKACRGDHPKPQRPNGRPTLPSKRLRSDTDETSTKPKQT